MTFTARKIFKQMYPATYNFKDEADGTSGEDIDYITAMGDGTAVISATYQGHRKVLKNSHGAAGSWYHTFTAGAQTAGTVEFFFIGTVGTPYFRLRESGGNYPIDIRQWGANIRFYYGDGVGGTTSTDHVITTSFPHIKITFDCATDTYSGWCEGIVVVTDVPFSNDMAITSIYRQYMYASGAYECYIDAVGCSWDTDYNIADNIHYRHFKESTDSFEGDDVGTQGDSITWIDFVDTAASFEIVQEFNAHKKILRGYYSSAAGGFDYCYHAFASQGKTGWFSTLMKVSDATIENRITLIEDIDIIINFRINGDKFQIFTGGAWRDVTGAPVPVDDTWYLIYIQWYDTATDTFDVWIDNIQYEAGTNCVANQTSGINRCYTIGYSATEYIYLDAPMSSLDSDERADNRTFDYHIHSYNDITTSVFRATVNDVAYQPSAAFITGASTLSIDTNHIIQLYDENGDLRFEGDFTRDILRSIISEYPLVSLNEDELEVEVSYTASAAEDVNATLLGNFTNVKQTDGRLIYYTEDDPAGNLTPNYRNKPNNRVIKGCAIHGGKYGIIKPNGVICLDDDRIPANGAATITEISGEIINNPKIDDTDLQFNYVLVRGAINPETGAPFYGVSEDTTAQTMSGIKRLYKRYRELQSNIDCQNRAISIRTGSGFTPTIINVQLKSIYALPGEIINFAYSHKSFSATNCYVEEVSHNLVTGVSSYRFNTGIFDRASMNEPGYTYADEASDDINETLYETDIITIVPELYGVAGGTRVDEGIQLNNIGERCRAHLYLSAEVDLTRDITVDMSWIRNDANNDTLTSFFYIYSNPADGTDGNWTAEFSDNTAIEACAITKMHNHRYTMVGGTMSTSNYIIMLDYDLIEVRDITVLTMTVRYYQKRSV